MAKNAGPKLYFSQYGGEQPIPAEFIAAMDRAEEVQSVDNSVGPEALSDTIVESKVETNRTDERVRRTVKKKAGNIVLQTIRTNDQGQPVQVTRTLFPTGTTPAIPSATQNVAVQSLGNGWSIQEVGVEGTYVGDPPVFTPGLFDPASFSKEVLDVVPERFRVAVPTTETVHDSAGTASMPTLGSGELKRQESQVTSFVKRLLIRARSLVGLPVSLVSKTTNEQKQVVTLTETLKNAGSDATPSAIQDVDVQNLGDGTVLQTVKAVSAVSTEGVYETSIPDPLPAEFAVLAPISTSEISSAGTVDTTPDLSTGDLTRRESQINTFVKRILLRTRAAVSVPVTLTQTELYEGIVATVTRVYNSGIQTVSAAYLTVASKVLNLGNNTSVKETSTVASFPQKQGQQFDETFNIGIPYTIDRKVMGADIGDVSKEITPVDFIRADVKALDLTAAETALAAFVLSFPGTTNIQFPDILVSVTGIIEKTQGDGTYDESGSGGWSGQGSASLSIRGTGQASAAIIPDLAVNIKSIYGNNIPTMQYLFFLLMPVTAAQVLTRLTALVGSSVTAWPKFVPEAHTFTLVGQRLSLQVTANANWMSGGSDSGDQFATSAGDGFSNEVGLTVRTVRTPPTIHGAISVGGDVADTENLTADASAYADSTANAYRTESSSVAGSITPTTLSATSGATSIPASGKRLLRVNAAPYKLGYAKIECEVVDFADVPQ
jgi:hypothetical protein